MIIRLTVEDNDYSDLMKNFVSNLSSRITRIPANIENMDSKRQLDIIMEIEDTGRLLNPNVTKKHTDEEKSFLIKRIKESFAEFAYSNVDDSTAEYLIEKFIVEIINSMEDTWENGEVWYWFQHSGVVLNQ